MNLFAAYTFEAPAAQVWDLLMDTEVIAGCLPGCRGMTPIGEDRYEAELAVAGAAISGSFKSTFAIEDKVRPESYRLLLEASGRPGFVKGEARVTLIPDGDSTTVRIAASADVGGILARVGQRLLEGAAKMTMDRFYGCLATRVQAPSHSGRTIREGD